MSDTPEERRRRRLWTIAGWIERDRENGEDSSLSGVIGKAVMKWGPKSETVVGYLTDMQHAGLIEVFEQEDRIAWIGGS